jgi:hypothetical protein
LREGASTCIFFARRKRWQTKWQFQYWKPHGGWGFRRERLRRSSREKNYRAEKLGGDASLQFAIWKLSCGAITRYRPRPAHANDCR